MDNQFKLNTIPEALEDFKAGKFLIVVDDEDRENEGDFIIAAEKITPEAVNFMLINGRGVLCSPITEERCQELELPKQVHDNTSIHGTPFTVTVDKIEGCTTGVSAEDRAATIRALADPASTPQTFGRPGHINPLRARSRGVLRRAAVCTLTRRSTSCRAYRSCRRPCSPIGYVPRRSPHRDNERRRYYGTYAAADRGSS